MKWQRLRDWLADFYHKFVVAYGIILACFAATELLKGTAPLLPLGYSTVMWVLALFFPGTAVLFALFNLRVRYNEIRDVGERNNYHLVYFPSTSHEAALSAFGGFVRLRFTEYHNMFELAGMALAAGVVTFLGAFFLGVQIDLPTYTQPVSTPEDISSWVVVLGSSFFGALAGAYVLIFRRYRTFDIYASTYLQVTVGIIVGTAAGGFLVSVWPSVRTSFLAFAIAFLTTINIGFLPRLLRDQFARLTGVKLPEEILTDLDRVIRNSEAIESLNSISIFSVADFVKMEPVRLYLNMPQPIGVINGWLDEALLHYYFPSAVSALHDAFVRRFTQLLEALVQEYRPNHLEWRANPVVTANATTDQALASTVKTIVSSRTHHAVLGFLAPNYRAAFFEIPDRAQPPAPLAL